MNAGSLLWPQIFYTLRNEWALLHCPKLIFEFKNRGQDPVNFSKRWKNPACLIFLADEFLVLLELVLLLQAFAKSF